MRTRLRPGWGHARSPENDGSARPWGFPDNQGNRDPSTTDHTSGRQTATAVPLPRETLHKSPGRRQNSPQYAESLGQRHVTDLSERAPRRATSGVHEAESFEISSCRPSTIDRDLQSPDPGAPRACRQNPVERINPSTRKRDAWRCPAVFSWDSGQVNSQEIRSIFSSPHPSSQAQDAEQPQACLDDAGRFGD